MFLLSVQKCASLGTNTWLLQGAETILLVDDEVSVRDFTWGSLKNGGQASDTAFLQKPFTPYDLTFKIRQVLDKDS